MKKTVMIIFPALFFLLSVSISPCHAFRCGNGLVTTGDTKNKVQMTCGKPSAKEKRCLNSWTGKKAKCDKKVEVWYYNCGDNDFVYALIFEGNTLTGENSEGRGHGPSECRGQ